MPSYFSAQDPPVALRKSQSIKHGPQGCMLANYSPRAKSGPQPIFVNAPYWNMATHILSLLSVATFWLQQFSLPLALEVAMKKDTQAVP